MSKSEKSGVKISVVIVLGLVLLLAMLLFRLFLPYFVKSPANPPPISLEMLDD